MGLFSFFKKEKVGENKSSENEFLDIETSMYNTEAQSEAFQEQIDYHNLVYNPPQNNVTSYKANRNNIGVVVDKDQFGYNLNDFNSNIKTYELQKDGDEETVELHNNIASPISLDSISEEETKEMLVPIAEEEIKIVENDQTDEANVIFSDITNKVNDVKVEDEFSLFGSKDDIGEKKDYENTNYEEEHVKLNEDVKMTKEGYKICPKCGTILKPDAPICFMCSNSFIQK